MNFVNTSLFVGDLPKFCSEADLEQLFSPYGPILDVKIKRNSNTGKTLSYGFVTFSTELSATEALKNLNNAMFCGRKLRVHWAMYNAKGNGATVQQNSTQSMINSVYVRFVTPMLDRYITEEDFHFVFDGFGNVVDASIKESSIDHRLGRQSGYGFVHFSCDQAGIDSAFRAVNAVDNANISNVVYNVELSKNLLKLFGEQQAQQAQQQQPHQAIPVPPVQRVAAMAPQSYGIAAPVPGHFPTMMTYSQQPVPGMPAMYTPQLQVQHPGHMVPTDMGYQSNNGRMPMPMMASAPSLPPSGNSNIRQMGSFKGHHNVPPAGMMARPTSFHDSFNGQMPSHHYYQEASSFTAEIGFTPDGLSSHNSSHNSSARSLTHPPRPHYQTVGMIPSLSTSHSSHRLGSGSTQSGYGSFSQPGIVPRGHSMTSMSPSNATVNYDYRESSSPMPTNTSNSNNPSSAPGSSPSPSRRFTFEGRSDLDGVATGESSSKYNSHDTNDSQKGFSSHSGEVFRTLQVKAGSFNNGSQASLFEGLPKAGAKTLKRGDSNLTIGSELSNETDLDATRIEQRDLSSSRDLDDFLFSTTPGKLGIFSGNNNNDEPVSIFRSEFNGSPTKVTDGIAAVNDDKRAPPGILPPIGSPLAEHQRRPSTVSSEVDFSSRSRSHGDSLTNSATVSRVSSFTRGSATAQRQAQQQQQQQQQPESLLQMATSELLLRAASGNDLHAISKLDAMMGNMLNPLENLSVSSNHGSSPLRSNASSADYGADAVALGN